MVKAEPAQPLNQAVDDSTRPQWHSRTEFILSLVGFAVGIGNVWRFPYLCFQNGGAVFLIPYLFVLLFLGIPIFALEISMGQLFRKNSLEIWHSISNSFSGVGIAAVLTTFWVSLYYNVIIAWSLFYLAASFKLPLPWKEHTAKDSFGNETVTRDASTFFTDHLLHQSDSIDHTGPLHWQLVLCLAVAWVLIYFIIFKGIESSGRAVYFTATFPYAIIFIMVVRALTLPGARDGIEFYLIPDFSKLGELEVWVKAAEQVFYSLGVGWGSLITFGSFNPHNHDFLTDAYLVPTINALTSFFAGFAVFGTAGYIAQKTGVDVKDLDLSGPGLVFKVYPTALAEMSGSNILSILFFFMLVLLAIDSQFALTETVIEAICEASFLPARWKLNSTNKWLVTVCVCVVSFCIGLLLVSEAGIYYISTIDGLSAGFTLFAVAALETISIAFVYGIDRYLAEAKEMLGKELADYYKYTLVYLSLCWRYISPVLAVLLIVSTVEVFATTNYDHLICRYPGDDDDYDDASHPDAPKDCRRARWGIWLGAGLSMFAVMMIPLEAIRVYFFGHPRNSERLQQFESHVGNPLAPL